MKIPKKKQLEFTFDNIIYEDIDCDRVKGKYSQLSINQDSTTPTNNL